MKIQIEDKKIVARCSRCDDIIFSKELGVLAIAGAFHIGANRELIESLTLLCPACKPKGMSNNGC